MPLDTQLDLSRPVGDGWVEKFGASKPVYSYSSVIDAMSENYGSTEAARDMFSHSVRNAGQNSPCYLFQGG